MDGFPSNTHKFTLLSASQAARRVTSRINITVHVGAEVKQRALGTLGPLDLRGKVRLSCQLCTHRKATQTF